MRISQSNAIPLPETELSTLITAIIGNTHHDVWINAKSTTATSIQAKINQQKEDLPLTEQIPKEYHKYFDVFDENKADHFPEAQPWNHKIELKEGFQPKSFKTYNLTPEEQKELDSWTKDIFDHLNPRWHPHSFMSKRKMGNYDPAKTIAI